MMEILHGLLSPLVLAMYSGHVAGLPAVPGIPAVSQISMISGIPVVPGIPGISVLPGLPEVPRGLTPNDSHNLHPVQGPKKSPSDPLLHRSLKDNTLPHDSILPADPFTLHHPFLRSYVEEFEYSRWYVAGPVVQTDHPPPSTSVSFVSPCKHWPLSQSQCAEISIYPPTPFWYVESFLPQKMSFRCIYIFYIFFVKFFLGQRRCANLIFFIFF